ncbi:hypothetical protein [Gimesia aquarii]|uniref:hypothetical protein n=1 Tax=Gimesia aquarii TaxID=2527964 RepID=UPI0011A8E402|nr:hypothetical protein [Gimesia aquarii]
MEKITWGEACHPGTNVTGSEVVESGWHDFRITVISKRYQQLQVGTNLQGAFKKGRKFPSGRFGLVAVA